MDSNEAGVEDDLGDIVGNGLNLELGGTGNGLCGEVDSEVEVDVVGLDLVEVGEGGGIVWHRSIWEEG